MKEKQNYMLCSDCGFAVRQSTMFIKKYQNTAICLCKKCAINLCTEIADYGIAKGLEKLKGGEQNDR